MLQMLCRQRVGQRAPRRPLQTPTQHAGPPNHSRSPSVFSRLLGEVHQAPALGCPASVIDCGVCVWAYQLQE
nr:MAG TPA: hypothetical protein [Caudoviricetes sp.]